MNIKSKDLINTVVFAGVSTLGCIAATQVVNGMRNLNDPYKKAKLKRKYRKIKNAFVNKTES